MAEFDVSWSFAAFRKVRQDFLAVHNRILKELEEVVTHAGGWFFHAVEIKDGWLRCDGSPKDERWIISVREAHYVTSPPKEDGQMPMGFPEAVVSADNDRFATFEAIRAEQEKLKKPSLWKAALSKVGFPLSRE